ncbi:MAG: hypothetical protein N2663_07855 [Chlorobi bacterium]|nr:hypothetical protein [Chlorobiota bacterium]
MLPVQLIVLSLAIVSAAVAQVEPLSAVNTASDDRAVALRIDSSGTELWITTTVPNQPLARMLRVFRSTGGEYIPTQSPGEPINLPSSPQRSARNGCVTFSVCSPDYAVFVSNRLVGGRDFDNDLYEMRRHGNHWEVRRLDVLCSSWWDDTPSLSPDGRLLFFASDRDAHERSRTDLYVSRWLDTGWSAPTKLAISSDDWNEQSPLAASDGYLYFATDRAGDYDIWRIPYDPTTGATIGTPEPIPFPGVNQRGSNEGHPAFAERGVAFLFSSDRTPARGFDVFIYRMPPRPVDSVTVRVVIRTRVVDWLTGAVEDSIAIYPNRPVRLRILSSNTENVVTTDAEGIIRLALPSRLVERWLLEAVPHSPRYVSSRDTLELSSICAEPPVHTLVVWDTATIVSPECVQDFPVKNVRFFVTGYWCPTTQRYAPWLLCTSLLSLDTCNTVYYEQPRLACTDNEIFRYRLAFVPPRAEQIRRDGSACIDMAEARSKGPQFARDVDAAIERIMSSMASALQAPCVQRAIADGEKITVTVTGWTDPRPLDPTCTYTGPTLSIRDGVVRLNTNDSPYIIDDELPGNGRIAFARSKAGGNYLLSQLRAFFAARLLDRLWEEQVPFYAKLKASRQLEVVAVGKAISQENRDFSERRSIEVRVEVPMPKRRVVAGQIPIPGSLVRLCQPPCAQR